MADPHFQEIEELVQESVFNPSPCRRLRARILHRAARAKQRAQISHRLLGTTLAVVVGVVIVIAGVRQFASRSSAPAQRAAVHAETGSAVDRPNLATRAPVKPAPSLGEALYRGESNAQR